MYFITGNSGKFAEVKAFIPDIEQKDIDLPEIQSIDPKEIISAKLAAATSHGLSEFIVEDTGLYIDCLNQLPGPLVKWFLKQLGSDGLADLISHYEQQTAHAITWIGYQSSTGEVQYFEGSIEGTIVAPRGEGFGWDPIFQPTGYTQTFGEMTREEKSTISMRKIAVQALVESLASSPK